MTNKIKGRREFKQNEMKRIQDELLKSGVNASINEIFLIKKFRKVTIRKEVLNESNKHTSIFT